MTLQNRLERWAHGNNMICAQSAYSPPMCSVVMSLLMLLRFSTSSTSPTVLFCSAGAALQVCWKEGFLVNSHFNHVHPSLSPRDPWFGKLNCFVWTAFLWERLVGGVGCGDQTGVVKQTLTILLWWSCDE